MLRLYKPSDSRDSCEHQFHGIHTPLLYRDAIFLWILGHETGPRGPRRR